FLMVDPESISEGEMETKTPDSDEDAVRTGNMQDVDLLVRVILNVNVVDRIEGTEEKTGFPVISAITTGVFRVMRPGTAEVLFSFDHEALPPDRKDEIKGFGNTEDKAIANSIDGFIPVSAEKLAWEIASKLEEPTR
ncbi:hypothetical protein ACFL6S_01355, partial [Candidatus Poribacteria bacterium]